jgi:hypothetical protein
MVARAVLYFFTMYDGIDISTVGSVATFKAWNPAYAPGAWELARNERLNKTQHNRNPYIDDPTLADQVFSTRSSLLASEKVTDVIFWERLRPMIFARFHVIGRVERGIELPN